MPKKKITEEKIEGLEEVANIFSVTGVNLQKYISRSNLKKLGEKMDDEVNVMGLVLSASKLKHFVFLLVHPKEKDKCMMITPDRDSAKKFYDALFAMEKKEGD